MFFVVGAQKSGTTMIHDWLCLEGCRLPRKKETHFFSHDEIYQLGLEWYEDQFIGNGIQGEVDPEYLYSPITATLIKRHYPEAKIVILLRDPIERAYSQYTMTVMRGLEVKSFYEAVNNEKHRENDINYRMHLSYIDRSIYMPQVQRFLKEFKNKNVYFINFDTIFSLRHKQDEYVKLCKFIGIQESVHAAHLSTKANQASQPLLKTINKLLWDKSSFSIFRAFLKIIFPIKKMRYFLGRKIDLMNRKKTAKVTIDYSKINMEIRSSIINDLQQLEVVTHLDLSEWKKRYLINES